MSKNRTLRVQRLENRQMMAGDVSFRDGVLTVDMDSAGPRKVKVGFVGEYVRVKGNVEFSPSTNDWVRTDQIQKIVVNGTERADTILLGSVHPRQFSALAGTEIRGFGRRDTIYGSRVSDIIFGGKGNDVIHGLDGDDVIRGGSGNDTINGGLGADLVFGGSGNDLLWGAAANADDKDVDRVFGGRGYDTYAFVNHWVGRNDQIRGCENDLRS